MKNFESKSLANTQGDDPEVLVTENHTHPHKIILEMQVDDLLIGTAELFHLELPVPHYKVSELYIHPNKRGAGYGLKLLQTIQKKIRDENTTGLLQDVVGTYEANAAGAAGMYERHGWVPVPGREDYFVYNLPADIDIGTFSTQHQSKAA